VVSFNKPEVERERATVGVTGGAQHITCKSCQQCIWDMQILQEIHYKPCLQVVWQGSPRMRTSRSAWRASLWPHWPPESRLAGDCTMVGMSLPTSGPTVDRILTVSPLSIKHLMPPPPSNRDKIGLSQ